MKKAMYQFQLLNLNYKYFCAKDINYRHYAQVKWNVMDFMTAATNAAHTGKPSHSLLPKLPASCEQVTNVA